ncbi:type II toxin-antitoxin system RelE/ParE family toxin [Sporolactobacillus nakayamae]|uniref:type II toxin-antitoxin system RelE/ParE family toxin n=1 Tax=Sporolactobacillus nakayamae TaxID=269670 RepID=UPI002481B10A|nr:type II toxin-antitoxin system RelE/ParE family toxin [Sporolactobacillus nakayamae]
MWKQNKPLYRLVSDAILEIRRDPAIGDEKNYNLAGVRSLDIYYQKTNYELAYSIEQDKEGNDVLVILFGSRENFYEVLRRYMNSLK